MGLSAPKKRTRISADPNNTTWSKSTDGFGHKILTAQGWTPGQLLGAKDAAHAEHLTAANASHIRVMLREDNLGLGAQLGKSNAETFGLSTLSGIFGRLNGKSDKDVEKAQSAQRDAELRAYQTHKFGHMTFVRGGLLVGDKMEEISKLEPASKSKAVSQTEQQQGHKDNAAQNPVGGDKKNKRKRKSDDEAASKDDAPRKKGKKSKGESTGKAPKPDESELDRNKTSQSDLDIKEPTVATDASDVSRRSAEKVARKAERAALKLAKLERKNARALKRAARQQRSAADNEPDSTEMVTSPVSSDRTPAAVNSFAGSRQAVRQRWIQQKRLASMDPRALSEILMLKTAVT